MIAAASAGEIYPAGAPLTMPFRTWFGRNVNSSMIRERAPGSGWTLASSYRRP